MRNIKLTLQYEGTGFSGWQGQKKGERTVQGVLEAAVFSLTGQRVSVVGAGRTDAGVHALGQIAAFRTASGLPVDTIQRAMNALLPPDVRVLSCAEAEDVFHPQYGSVGKEYFYLIANMPFVSPFLMRYAWLVPYPLDIGRMREAASLLVGTRDFRAFMASGSGVKSTVRELRSLKLAESSAVDLIGTSIEGKFIKTTFEASGFLRHMVRNIMGTLVEVGRGKMATEAVREALTSGNRRLAGPTAPPNGLFLKEVFYGAPRTASAK